jgi:hypothetical protein
LIFSTKNKLATAAAPENRASRNRQLILKSHPYPLGFDFNIGANNAVGRARTSAETFFDGSDE